MLLERSLTNLTDKFAGPKSDRFMTDADALESVAVTLTQNPLMSPTLRE